jgi:hypothetical protein
MLAYEIYVVTLDSLLVVKRFRVVALALTLFIVPYLRLRLNHLPLYEDAHISPRSLPYEYFSFAVALTGCTFIAMMLFDTVPYLREHSTWLMP